MQAREGFLCFCSESSIKAERLFCFALLCFQKFPCASLVLNETKLCGWKAPLVYSHRGRIIGSATSVLADYGSWSHVNQEKPEVPNLPKLLHSCLPWITSVVFHDVFLQKSLPRGEFYLTLMTGLVWIPQVWQYATRVRGWQSCSPQRLQSHQRRAEDSNSYSFSSPTSLRATPSCHTWLFVHLHFVSILKHTAD